MAARGKNVLIVYAHPEPASFNGALRDTAVTTLRKSGHNVKVSDLYAMQFKASTSKDDIIGNLTKQPFQYSDEAEAACKEGRLSQDILDEIEKLEWADLLILQFPIQWFSVPALMKGWIDRVFVKGRIFSGQKMYSTGVFKGKRAMISCTTGSPTSVYQPNGVHGDINMILWPIENGWLNFVGYNVLKSNICFGVLNASDEDLKKMLRDWEKRLPGLFDEKPLKFFTREDFDHHGFGPLKPESFNKATKDGSVPLGQRDAAALPGYTSGSQF